MRRPHGALPPILPLTAALVLGCAPPRYEPPSLDEPHATVTVRLVHHEVSGPHFEHQTLIDGHALGLDNRSAVVRGAPLTRSVRVRPSPARWIFRSRFTHQERSYQTVYEQERYPCGTRTTGYGTSSRSVTNYCTREVPRQRLRVRTVTDGLCEARLLHTPRIDRRYLVQFDYHAHASCRVRCFEQTPLPDGSFRLAACNLLAPPERPPPPAPRTRPTREGTSRERTSRERTSRERTQPSPRPVGPVGPAGELSSP